MRSFTFRRALLNIVASSLVLISFSEAAQARTDCRFEERDGGFTGSVLVRGTPQEVFTAIQDSRSSDRRKVLSVSGNSVLLEEKFNDLPVIGQARCRYREVEVPHQRIDYQIVDSKQFKRFDGKWELCPISGGKATMLKLTSCVDTYLKVPFSKRITDHGNKKDISRRLSDIKTRVERAGPAGRQISCATH